MKKYRKGVGIVLINKENKVFVAQRIDTPDDWQMPQGGIDENEKPEIAVLRELKEEIGINNVTILAATDWLKYEIPKEMLKTVSWGNIYCGQEQKWFFLRFNGKDSEINLNFALINKRTHISQINNVISKNHIQPEFKDWMWVNYTSLVDLIIDFKKDMYKQIIEFGIKNNIFE